MKGDRFCCWRCDVLPDQKPVWWLNPSQACYRLPITDYGVRSVDRQELLFY